MKNDKIDAYIYNRKNVTRFSSLHLRGRTGARERKLSNVIYFQSPSKKGVLLYAWVNALVLVVLCIAFLKDATLTNLAYLYSTIVSTLVNRFNVGNRCSHAI